MDVGGWCVCGVRHRSGRRVTWATFDPSSGSSPGSLGPPPESSGSPSGSSGSPSGSPGSNESPRLQRKESLRSAGLMSESLEDVHPEYGKQINRRLKETWERGKSRAQKVKVGAKDCLAQVNQPPVYIRPILPPGLLS